MYDQFTGDDSENPLAQDARHIGKANDCEAHIAHLKSTTDRAVLWTFEAALSTHSLTALETSAMTPVRDTRLVGDLTMTRRISRSRSARPIEQC